MDSTFTWTTQTNVEFLLKLPGPDRLCARPDGTPEKTLLIFDRRLRHQPAIKAWIDGFELKYPVEAGEGLKDLGHLTSHLKKIFKRVGPFSARSLSIVALGGGSVGDFAGFIASILKRGVPLVHMPTTLLAAMDSAHGGKTALNVGGIKNQIGTFYPGARVCLVRSLFEKLDRVQLESAGGELVKMALIAGGDFFARVERDFTPDLEKIWTYLPEAIEAKYAIVERDPRELGGERQILNFGHTLGHALESKFKLAHGLAVGFGVVFAVEWSAHRGYLRRPGPLLQVLKGRAGFSDPRRVGRLTRAGLKRLVTQDKKMNDSQHINFVFIEAPGKVFRKSVPVEALLAEAERQGWTP